MISRLFRCRSIRLAARLFAFGKYGAPFAPLKKGFSEQKKSARAKHKKSPAFFISWRKGRKIRVDLRFTAQYEITPVSQ
jgi:hypothetical protein